MGQIFSSNRHSPLQTSPHKTEADIRDSSLEVDCLSQDNQQVPATDAIPLLKKAKGHYWYPTTGPKILDACGGAGVACLGHGRKDIAKAVSKQMSKIHYASYAHFKLDPVLELEKFLIESTEGVMGKVYLMCSGSEATEASLKLALEYHIWNHQPSRINFISRSESYHGTTLGSLSASGHPARREPFLSLLNRENFSHIPACNPYRQRLPSETDVAFIARKTAELETEFLRLGPETVAAVILEPVVGAALGCVPPPKGYLAAIKTVCKKYGALVIFDEVMCGMGRTGWLHAWQEENTPPDLQCTAKSFSAGYLPASALLVSSSITQFMNNSSPQKTFTHGHTYQNHPAVAAAALKVQRIIRDEHLLENVQTQGALLERLLKERLATHQNVGEIRGKGLFWGIEFVTEKKTKQPFAPEMQIAQLVQKLAMKKYQVLVYHGQGCAGERRGDHVMVMPAYDVSSGLVREIVERVSKAVEEVFRDL
ncbi:pyridoxal phosphate-dependent transferase [Podospora australis]|uniref:Pyridoxal phosphate-dependent transferase n=1 Tax=Podospora australis TaxID=1536484 RepID=A0AAN7AK27_9PEZI|nr:pyridoxal phosphate-dependent transferase [Podospora australis]